MRCVWISDPYGWGSQHGFADVVHEEIKPKVSKLLGPDGNPMPIDINPIGFDLRPLVIRCGKKDK